MKIALLQMQPASGAPERNLETIEKAARSAAAFGADMLVTPELSLSGYALGADFAEIAEPLDGAMIGRLRQIAETVGIAIVAGFPERDGEHVFNSAAFVCADGTVQCYRKCHLYGEAEKAAFQPSDTKPAVFEFNSFRVGMLICFDVEFPEMTRGLALAGAELVIVPTALPSTADSPTISQHMIPTRALENHVFMVYADLCGTERHLTYFGGSVIAGPDGRELARAGRNEALLMAEIEHAVLESARAENPYLAERRPELYR
ncbi:carbon-nitrogen hydrolase family protein [Rhizobium sp. NRK18]|uniref:carbon-nitrogen hydrolase family protein n=1 Tax=Rhizobium sp. NRK18 TaxID=2964667 RepID=UPI0021C2C6D4|nr:carbon-nitrogen hydrolase family protein [Rhizobium sp. NRK18]MCQ2006090.1 carbon-nitrogen hydrolase family protein [Rhizobium sp. NRK18]